MHCLYTVSATSQSTIDRSTKIKHCVSWAVNIFHLHHHATTIPTKLSDNNTMERNYVFTCDCKTSAIYQYITHLIDSSFLKRSNPTECLFTKTVGSLRWIGLVGDYQNEKPSHNSSYTLSLSLCMNIPFIIIYARSPFERSPFKKEFKPKYVFVCSVVVST